MLWVNYKKRAQVKRLRGGFHDLSTTLTLYLVKEKDMGLMKIGKDRNREEIRWIFQLFDFKEIRVKLRRNNIEISSQRVCFSVERKERND